MIDGLASRSINSSAMVSIMKIEDDAALNNYLVKHLQPLTEADPNILAKYVWALLKHNKPKTELQAFCTEKLIDFLGEDSKTFVVNLFHALEDGTILTHQEEVDTRVEDDSASMPATSIARVASIGDNTDLKASSQAQKQSDANNLGSMDHEDEGSDDEDDDRNHKHRRRVERSRSLDRDTQDGPLRKRNRSDDTNPTEEFQRGSSFMEKDGLPKRRMGRDHVAGAATRLGMDANQRGLSRGASMLRNDGLGSRFEHQNGLSRGLMGRGRGGTPSLLGSREQRAPPIDASDPNALMLSSGLSKNLFTGRSGLGRGNPSHSPWLGYNRFTGMTNGTLDHALPLNAGMQGSRGVSISPAVGVGMNIGMGLALRPRCPDFEERGYCLRGDLCPMEHGANRIVVEDVQSLSKFNLPVALPSGRGMALGTVSVSSSSLAPFSGVSNIVTRDINMSALGSNASTEPDLYDPDQPLWNKEQPASLVDGLRKLPPFRKDSELESSAVDRSRRQSPEDEAYGKSSSALVRSQGVGPGQSVWNRIGRVDQGDSKDGGIPMFADLSVENSPFLKVQKREAPGPLNSPGKWKADPDERFIRPSRGTTLKSGGNGTPEREAGGLQPHVGYNPHGGRSLRIPSERAHNTLYVGCLPSNPNRKDLLMAHFQRFGDIVDMRVPASGDRAFVQFLRHEDAEAALNSPDAVMGNRFIRLSWAKRDSVPVFSMEGTMVLPTMAQVKDFGLGDLQGLARDASASMMKGKKQVDGVSTPLETIKNKQAAKVSISSSNTGHKKQEELEHMKEAIRKKQETLAQKREEFRRILERLSKQGNGTASELEDGLLRGAKGTASDQTTNKDALLEKEGADDKGVHKQTFFVPVPAEKASTTSDQTASVLIKDPSKQLGQVSSGALSQPSPRGLRGHSLWPSPGIAGSQWAPLRYKIDNRTTVFRVLAPLPDSLLDVAMLKHHFQFFGEVVSVEIEDSDRQGEPNSTEQATAKVTFSTRSAAEKAYGQGRWFQGAPLQFSWVNPPRSTSPGIKSSENVHAEGKETLLSGLKSERAFEEQLSRAQTSAAGDDGFDNEGGGETGGELKIGSEATLTTGTEKVAEEEGKVVESKSDG